tara:strand:+ start:317 stop:478 length:162 start_codon:yes stop_codon:yes gene_type:complete
MNFKIQDVQWDPHNAEEVYFTLIRDYDGVTGKLQLNMWSIIHDEWRHEVEWEE